ncbi:MAG: polymerase, sigma-24 subunit, subfamily [Ferruginibacter sp.]|nr:polymerase, sigma-24 subunit, subfamily [Ferruginibacter sp.]
MKPVSADIISGCLSNNLNQQRQLYEHCYPEMVKLCLLYSRDPDEAAALYNAAMLKVFSGISGFNSKGELMGWIRRIVVNTCIDDCRKRAKFIVRPIDDISGDTFQINPEAYDRINANEIVHFIKELPLNTALVFNLFVLEGYKHEEIAMLLGISAGTSKWHLNEARRLLKMKLDHSLKQKTYAHVS